MNLHTRIFLIVLVVSAIGALAAIMHFVRTSGREKQLFTKTMLTVTSSAIQDFHQREGHWPDSLDDLGIKYIYWGRYPEQDAWRRKIVYRRFDPGLGFGAVLSYGADGKPGGDGFAEDLEVRFGLDFPTMEQIQSHVPNSRGGANGKEPFRSETNHASVPAVSRRSPGR